MNLNDLHRRLLQDVLEIGNAIPTHHHWRLCGSGPSPRRLLKILAGSGAVCPVCGHVAGMQGERPGELAGPDVWETCRELIPAGSVFAFLAEHREALFPAGMFADMYPSPNGRPRCRRRCWR